MLEQGVFDDNELLDLEILLKFINKFWRLLEIPDYGALMELDSKIEKVDSLLIYCLSCDPNDTRYRNIRSKALSVLLNTHYMNEEST